MSEYVGYKAFNADRTNRYGMKFEEGKTYHTDGEIKSGNDGNGFHMSLKIANVFRYFDSDNIVVAKVTGFGECDYLEATSFGRFDYDDMYSCEYMRIDKFMSREEVVDTILNENANEVCKFLISFKANVEELERIYDKFSNDKMVINTMLYYRLGYKDIYDKPRDVDVAKVLKLKKQS